MTTPPPNPRRRACLWAALALPAGLCILTLFLLAAGMVSARLSGSPSSQAWRSLPLNVCIGVSARAPRQFGVAWASPIISYAPSILYSPNALCTTIPGLGYLPLPPVGQIAFPP